MPATWVRVRNMIGDIKSQFPQGVVGPFFNDRFGDVYGNIYAFTSDGVSRRQLRDYVEDVRAQVLRVKNVGKVDLIGAQDEVIYLEFSTSQIAALGIDRQAVIQTLQAQNAIVPSGVVQAGAERISLRVSGQFTSEESLKAINLRVNDRFFRLSDVATITRGYVDPPTSLFRFKGEPAIGLAVGMKPGANLLEFGDALKAEMRRIVGDLPIGVGVHLVSDQPVVVEHAVGGFTRALFEAVAIVLVVSFISLGMRAGLVVALSIPLVLAITFVAMEYLGISLQRISLGALIIALGLLVDDAMIAVEMMVARLEVGDTLRKAATYVYTSTAFPMLTGTLVTVAGFIPIGLNSSSAGEYTFTLFVVIAISLVVSWVVAVLFTPLLGVVLLKENIQAHHGKPGRFTTLFRRLLALAMGWRWTTIALTVAMFAASVFGMRYVEQQFFPSSDRPELVIDFNLPQNASIAATKAQMDRFERTALAADPDIEYWSSYVGQGAVRFVLSFDVQPSNPFFGQVIVVTKSFEARQRVAARLSAIARRDFVGTDITVTPLALGPPSGRPVQYRVSGPDLQKLRDYAQTMAGIVASDPRVGDVAFDWNEPARVVKVDVLQDKARLLGVTSEDIASALNGLVGGATVTQVRDHIYLINVIGRARANERSSIETFQNLQLPVRNGTVPLAAVANFAYELEQPVVWRTEPRADHHRQVGHPRRHPAGDHRQCAGAARRGIHQGAAAGLWRASRRPGRGQRQGAGPDRGRGAADAVRDGDHPDDPAPELPPAVPGGGGRAAGADRRRRCAAAESGADGIRRDPGHSRADRNPDPQLRDPDRADRASARRGQAGLGRRGRSDRAPHAADPADRGGREPGADPDRARGVLGPDGLRHDGRHHRRHRADAAVPAGAVHRLVPDQGAGCARSPEVEVRAGRARREPLFSASS